jgi:hypothetical protein
MKLANSLAAIALGLWGLLTFAGVTAYQSIRSQNVDGYPNSGQTTLYLVVPIAALCFLLVITLVFNRTRGGATLLAVCAGASLLPLAWCLMLFGGGV